MGHFNSLILLFILLNMSSFCKINSNWFSDPHPQFSYYWFSQNGQYPSSHSKTFINNPNNIYLLFLSGGAQFVWLLGQVQCTRGSFTLIKINTSFNRNSNIMKDYFIHAQHYLFTVPVE